MESSDPKFDIEGLKMQKEATDPFKDELEEIPFYMRERVAQLIEEKVNQQVKDHMTKFRDEVNREMEDQRIQNQ